MSRGLVAANETEINADHLHEVILVKFEFDTPVYVHSGLGTISYDGNNYLGVGRLGNIGAAKESETIGPQPIELSLDVTNAGYVDEALDAGNLYDPVTIYVGYRNDDGTLVADPWIAWKGYYEYASIRQGNENLVSITCQHDLSRLDEKEGARYSDEDQQDAYSGDVGLEFMQDMADVKLFWAGGPLGYVGGGRGRDPGDPPIHPL